MAVFTRAFLRESTNLQRAAMLCISIKSLIMLFFCGFSFASLTLYTMCSSQTQFASFTLNSRCSHLHDLTVPRSPAAVPTAGSLCSRSESIVLPIKAGCIFRDIFVTQQFAFTLLGRGGQQFVSGADLTDGLPVTGWRADAEQG